MAGLFSAVFGGENDQLNQDIDQSNQQATWDTGQGQSDVMAGTTFLKSILGGDPTKTAQVLAPTISANNKTVQQDQKTGAMTGNRGGGTNASTTAAVDKAHSDLVNAIAGLTGTAATALPSIGTNLTSQGTQATDLNAKLAQQRFQNWINSWLGKSTSEAATTALDAGLGAAAGSLPGGPGAAAGAQGAISDVI
jgi:hypothetical protein